MVAAPTTLLNLADMTLLPNTLYFWAVQAINGVGTTQTPTRSFTTQAPPLPGAFNLVSPLNGTTNVETGPLLDWSDSTGADDYLVEVDNNISFASPEVSQVVGASQIDLADGTLDLNTQYFWRVTANNMTGSTGSTPALSSFTTTATAPCACIGDLDGNCTTDVLDFSVFTAAFGSQLGEGNFNPDADYDNDDVITVLDFGLWAGDFGCID
jgi:hypothetical protein